MAKREHRSAVRSNRTDTRRQQPAPAPETAGTHPTSSSTPPAEALAAFESAVRALQAHAYREAADQFRDLLSAFPAERALLDRVRVYLELCDRELRRRPVAPETLEERLTLATAALNDDRDEEAEQLAQEVLGEDPENDLALYLMAAVRARRGENEAALDVLRRALAISPDVGAQARHDADFEVLRDSPEFQALVELSLPADAASQKDRGGRADR